MQSTNTARRSTQISHGQNNQCLQSLREKEEITGLVSTTWSGANMVTQQSATITTKSQIHLAVWYSENTSGGCFFWIGKEHNHCSHKSMWSMKQFCPGTVLTVTRFGRTVVSGMRSSKYGSWFGIGICYILKMTIWFTLTKWIVQYNCTITSNVTGLFTCSGWKRTVPLRLRTKS